MCNLLTFDTYILLLKQRLAFGSYQGVDIDDLEFQRVLFGFFPTYKRSPLPAEWDRVCQIGDARCVRFCWFVKNLAEYYCVPTILGRTHTNARLQHTDHVGLGWGLVGLG